MPKETRGFKWGTALLVLAVIIELFILAAIGARGATPTPTPSPASQPMKVETKSHLVLPPDPPSPVAPADFDFSGVKVIGLPQATGNSGTRLLTGGGVAWTGTGLNFIISAATYLINGTAYASPQTPVTLAAADPDDDRIDVFYTDSSSSAGKITGTPGGPPLEPQVNPLTQLRLTTAYVPAGAGTPLITNEEIYLENTEWTTSTNSSGTITLASTNNPYAGSKCVEATNAANGNYWSAVKPASGTVNLADYASLVIQLRSKATWPKQKSLSLFFLNGSSTVGNPVSLKDGDFNFNSSNTTTYQQIVIPASRFNTGSAPVTTLRIAVTGGGGNIGWYMDNVVLQTGLITGGGGGDFSTNSSSSVAGQVVVAADTTGKLGAFDSHTGIAALIDGVLNTVNVGSGLSYNTSTRTLQSSISGNALTKGDDTNVTLTLGGSPSTALLAAASITAGWAGQLGLSRGGTGKDFSGVTDGQIPIGKTSDHTLNLATITGGAGISVTNGAGSITITNSGVVTATHAATFVCDGYGSVLTSGTKAYVKIPYGGTLQGWTLVGSPSGSITVDIYRAADGAGLPVTSIVGGGGTKPALSTAAENSSTSFTGWTSTTLTAKDNLAIAISGVTATTYVALTLYYQ